MRAKADSPHPSTLRNPLSTRGFFRVGPNTMGIWCGKRSVGARVGLPVRAGPVSPSVFRFAPGPSARVGIVRSEYWCFRSEYRHSLLVISPIRLSAEMSRNATSSGATRPRRSPKSTHFRQSKSAHAHILSRDRPAPAPAPSAPAWFSVCESRPVAAGVLTNAIGCLSARYTGNSQSYLLTRR